MSSKRRGSIAIRKSRALVLGLTFFWCLTQGSSALAAPAAPTPLEPANSTTTLWSFAPTFSWTSVPGAAKYQLQLSSTDTFANSLGQVDTVATAYTPIKAMADGVVYWRVKAIDAANVSGPWSEVWSFSKRWGLLPLLIQPPSTPDPGSTLAFLEHPTFSWRAVEGAAGYKWELSMDPNFTSPALPATITKNTNYTPAAGIANSIYYWRITPIDPQSHLGERSEARSFLKNWQESPRLLEPADGIATPFTPTFRWTAVRGADHYVLDISSSSEFPEIAAVTQHFTTDNTVFTLTKALSNDQAYFWAVKAVDAQGDNGPYREVRRFFMKWYLRPILLTPVDGSTSVALPVFQWTPVNGAKEYELEVNRDSNFSPDLAWRLCSVKTKNTFLAPTGAPATRLCRTRSGETYYWRVRAIDEKGNFAPWTSRNNAGDPAAPFSFSWDGAASPLQFSPPYYYSKVEDLPTFFDTATSVPTFAWGRVNGAERYLLEVADTPSFCTDPQSHPLWSRVTENLSFTPDSGVSPQIRAGDIYYWRVSAQTAQGQAVGQPSQCWKFRVDPKLLPPATDIAQALRPKGLTPIPGPFPSLEWTPVGGSTFYTVEIARDASFTLPVDSALTVYTHYTPTASQAEGTYYWRVRADGGTWSRPASFVLQPSTLVPQPLWPADDSPGSPQPRHSTPMFYWHAPPTMSQVKEYHIQVALDPFFTNIWTDGDGFVGAGGGDQVVTPLGTAPDNNAYYWHVRVIRTDGSAGDWSPTYYFSKESPRPVNLAAGPTETTPTISWSRVEGAAIYRLEVSADENFSTTKYVEGSDHQTSHTWTNSLPDGRYFWRVRGKDGSGYDMPWTATQTFVKSSPVPVPAGPASGSILGDSPTFQWAATLFPEASPFLTASRYRLGISRDPNFSTFLESVVTPNISFTPIESYAEGTYYWKLCMEDGSANCGPSSQAQSFSRALPSVQKVSPADGQRIEGFPAFQWSSVIGMASYDVEVATDANFSTKFDSVHTDHIKWTPIKLYKPGRYFWRVRAIDGSNNPGPWGNVTSFTVPDVTPPTVKIDQPTEGATVSGNFAVRVTLSDDVAVVRAELYVDGSLIFTATTFPFSYSWQTAPYANGTHVIAVKAWDAAGNSSSDTRTVKVSNTAATTSSTSSSTAAPQVTAVSPLDGNTFAPVVVSVNATFNEAVSGVSVSSFLLKTAFGTVVPAAVSYDGVSRKGILAPKTLLIPGLYYSASLTGSIVSAKGVALKPKTWAFRVTSLQDNLSPAAAHSWRTFAVKAALGGSYATSNVGGALATFTFTGTAVAWYTLLNKDQGKALVYIDGVLKGTFDNYAAAAKFRYPRVLKGLTNKAHVLRIIVAGTKNKAATNALVSIDGYGVGKTLYQQQASKFFWKTVTNSYAGARTLSVSEQTGDAIALPFYGVSITWYTVKAKNQGKVAVYIDGKLKNVVDNYAPATSYKVPVAYSGLPRAAHTLKLVVLGVRSLKSTANVISVDGFAVK